MNKIDDFNDRRAAAAEARQAALRKFQARPSPDSPEVRERMAAQKLLAEAREARQAERKAERAAEAARALAAERARLAEEAARAAALLAEQKAARDARYAARKKRR